MKSKIAGRRFQFRLGDVWARIRRTTFMKGSGHHSTFVFNLYMYDRDHHILSPFLSRPCRLLSVSWLPRTARFFKSTNFCALPGHSRCYADFRTSSVEHRPLRTLLASEVRQPSCVHFLHEVPCTHTRAFDLGEWSWSQTLALYCERAHV